MTGLTHWSNKYIGIPYSEEAQSRSGTDCWRLVRQVWMAECGIEVPDYFEIEYRGKQDITRVGKFIQEHAKEWHLVCDGKQLMEQPKLARPFDAILFRLHGLPLHIGVVTEPKRVLHVEEGIGSVVEDFTTFNWRNRIFGVYRHERLLAH